MSQAITRHYSAFGKEIVKYFELSKGIVFYDLTLGDGGHTETALDSGCRVISFDVDPEAIRRATDFLKSKHTPLIITDINLDKVGDEKWVIVNANFTKISEVVEKLKLPLADAIMVDLGPSQFQVLSPQRGFSFLVDEPLDMRLSPELGVTAADLLGCLNEGELSNLFSLGDEPFAKPIARAVVKRRQISPIKTTLQLADLVKRVKRSPRGKTNPATQVFMALRMAVNLEREVINELLPQLPKLLSPNGILGVISFHSGEDRIVKNFLKEEEQKGTLSAIYQKPCLPKQEELEISNRTRSAKLRLARKNN